LTVLLKRQHFHFRLCELINAFPSFLVAGERGPHKGRISWIRPWLCCMLDSKVRPGHLWQPKSANKPFCTGVALISCGFIYGM